MNPMVITIEKDYINWNTTFPSLTLCSIDKINETALNQYISDSHIKNKKLLRKFLQQLSNLTLENIDNIINYPDIHPNDYIKILNYITYKNNVIITTAYNKTYFMKRILTEMGICYTFNSKIANYMTPEYLMQNDNYEVINENHKYKEYFVTIYDIEKIAFTTDINSCCEVKNLLFIF